MYHHVSQIKELRQSSGNWSYQMCCTRSVPFCVLQLMRLLTNVSCRSSTGSSIPSWLAEPGLVYVKRHVRHSKFDPLVEKVDVFQANPHYAHIRYPDGRENTVSTKHLAPYGHVEHVEAPTSTQVPTAET